MKAKEQVKDIALRSGFKLKEQPNGEMDLNPYVYEFAELFIKVVAHDLALENSMTGKKSGLLRHDELHRYATSINNQGVSDE